MPLAIVIAGSSPQRVKGFVRDDVPVGWTPPDGTVAVPSNDLAPGWVLVEDEPKPVPESVSPYQFRAWLINHGISLAQIDALLAAIPDELERDRSTVAWEYGLEVKRTHPMVSQFGAALGMTAEQIDAAFREAATYA